MKPATSTQRDDRKYENTYKRVSPDPETTAISDENLDEPGLEQRQGQGQLAQTNTQDHVADNAEKKRWICPICKDISDSKEALFTHAAQSHKRRKIAACAVCPNKVFANHRNLVKHHTRVHRERETAMCPICKKVYVDEVALERHHGLVHLRVERSVCGICNKFFATKQTLRRHMTAHSMELDDSELLL